MKNLQLTEFAPYYENYIKLVPEQDIIKGLTKQKGENDVFLCYHYTTL